MTAPDDLQEFHYRLPSAVSGFRPGAHAGISLGTGQAFAAHVRLFDSPDPRRLDLRASLRDVRRDWLVRLYRQRAAVPVHAVVDVSASMCFGARRPKLDVVADFAESLGHSAFRAGDPVGLLAFDAAQRDDLAVPARHRRGTGVLMGELLRQCAARGTDGPPARVALGSASPTGGALTRTVERLAGKAGLVFVVSDFHWPLHDLDTALESLAHACVIPIVVWDPAEIEPPPDDALLAVRDAETGLRHTLWVGPRRRDRWREQVAQRRAALASAFAERGVAPFCLQGGFDPEALSRYFLETFA